MNGFLHGVARAVVESFDLPGPILEVGSYQVTGQEHVINLRSLFPNREYVGIDFRPGPGVDQVADVESLPFANESFGTVIALSTFEHVRRFWLGFQEVRRVLRPDGVFVVACPFYFHIHAYPNDYWRFTPEGFEVMLDSYPTRILGWHGPERRPLDVWVVAFREKALAPTAEQFTTYQRKLHEYGREPMSWVRKLRYRLGRFVAGRRPFSIYFDRERWQTELRTSSAGELPDVAPAVTRQSRVA